MAYSTSKDPELFLFVDDSCIEQEIRNVVRRLKRKLHDFHVTDTHSTNSQGSVEIPFKRKRKCKNKTSPKKTKCTKVKTNGDDDASNSMEFQGKIEEQQVVEKSKTKRKLTSRLSRLFNKKRNKVKRTGSSTCKVDSYDTDSCSSVDSGIHCGSWNEMNLRTPATDRDKSNIVAMDCEFVGIGPKSRNALGVQQCLMSHKKKFTQALVMHEM